MFIKEKDKKLNISFDTDNENNIQLWKDIYGVHAKIGNEILGDYPEINKIEDYFYEMDIDKLDEEYAYSKFPNPYGACSGFRNGNFIGRSYDWYYNNACEFIIHNKAVDGRFESIGIASSDIPESDMSLDKYNEGLKSMPFRMLDGINSEGVYCSINVVPHGDKGNTTGTNPSKKNLPNVCIPRLVLDKASSARKAIDLLKQRNIFAINYDGEIIELHALIADKNSTYVVEFINNKMVVFSDQDDEFKNLPNNKPIITNFYLDGWNGEIKTGYTGYSKEEIDETGLTRHAQGLERYKIISDGLDNVTNIDKALELVKEVRYTKGYSEETSPFWYSEFSQTRPNIDIYSTEEEFQDLKETAIRYFNERSRDTGLTWQSVHQCAYDLENKVLKVIVQETDTVYEFSL